MNCLLILSVVLASVGLSQAINSCMERIPMTGNQRLYNCDFCVRVYYKANGMSSTLCGKKSNDGVERLAEDAMTRINAGMRSNNPAMIFRAMDKLGNMACSLECGSRSECVVDTPAAKITCCRGRGCEKLRRR